MKIWKYKLRYMPHQQFSAPIGATILAVQIQNNIPVLWLLFDEKLQAQQMCSEVRNIYMYLTGDTIVLPAHNPLLCHIGTVQIGQDVLHYFAEKI